MIQNAHLIYFKWAFLFLIPNCILRYSIFGYCFRPFIFQDSNGPTLGVEIELQLIDPTILDLSKHSGGLLQACQKNTDRVTGEIHTSMIEVVLKYSLIAKETSRDRFTS
ncbi:MAG: hypothetical protein QRY74_01105 [Chlamydia sp.]